MTTTDLDFDETFAATTPAPSGDVPTERQVTYIADLRARWQRAEDAIAQSQGRAAVRPAWVDPATRSEASVMIEKGIAALAVQADTMRTVVAERAGRVVTEGMWIIGTLGQDGAEVFKVQQAVHDQVAHVVGHGLAGLGRFACTGVIGDGDVAQHRERGRDAARRRVGQQHDIGQACFLVLGDGGRN